MTMERYVVITGGQLYNKGAQAMTYITVDEIKKRFPDLGVILFSSKDANRKDINLNNFNFQIRAYPKQTKIERILFLFKPFRKIYYSVCGNNKFKEYVEIVKNAEAVIDISGYALGSDWGVSGSLSFCQKMWIASDFSVPIYLMPQSFGPFDYPILIRHFINNIIKRTLKCAQCIMVREYQGFELLKKFNLGNVVKTDDLVLQNTGIELSNVFKLIPECIKYDIPTGSVAVIPNTQICKRGNEQKLIDIYSELINYLLGKGKNIFLLYHSTEDKRICEKIYELFDGSKKLFIIDKDFSCIEFDQIVKAFDYIIGSRYHSIVHAYRNYVPAIIIGWAVKYHELAERLNQDSYLINIDDDIKRNSILEVLKKLDSSYVEESDNIRKKIEIVQKDNVYDMIKI